MVPKGIRDSQITLLAKKIAANLNTELLAWLPFSDDILGSLSKSVFVLSGPKKESYYPQRQKVWDSISLRVCPISFGQRSKSRIWGLGRCRSRSWKSLLAKQS